MKSDLAWKLGFLGFAESHTLSALEGKGLGALMRSVDAAYAAAMAKLSTPKITTQNNQPAEHAAYTSVCLEILNLDEALTKE